MAIDLTVGFSYDHEIVSGSFEEDLRVMLQGGEFGGERFDNGCIVFTQTLLRQSGPLVNRVHAALAAALDAASAGLEHEEWLTRRRNAENAHDQLRNRRAAERRAAQTPETTTTTQPRTRVTPPASKPSAKPVRRAARAQGAPDTTSVSPVTEVRSQTAPAGTLPSGQKPQGQGFAGKVRAAFGKN